MNARMNRRVRRAGFTLVELMVAMIAGLVAVSGAYVLATNSTRNISEQMRMADTQMSLRSAMDQVRRDFGRAGYLGTRNSLALPVTNCDVATSTLVVNHPVTGAALGTPAVTAAGIYINGSLGLAATGAATTAVLNPTLVAGNDQNLTRADVVTLQGSYAAGTMFPVSNMAFPTNERVIEIDDMSTTFQMVFWDAPPGGGAGVYSPSRFQEMFSPGRAIRFESDGRFYFRVISTVNPAATPPTITLDPAEEGLPTNLGCAPRGGAFVSVLSLIKYEVDPINGGSDNPGDTPADLAALNHPTVPIADLSASWKRAALVRREISYATQAPIVPSTAAVVLDNVVEFQVNAIRNSAPSPLTPVFERLTEATPLDVEEASTGAATAGQLRALIVTLSARAVEGERLPMHRRRTSLDRPMMTFQMGDPAAIAAGGFFVSRVRTVRSEIFLANMVD